MRAALERLASVPRRRLAITPSPLTHAPALAAAAGLRDLWLKRDELLGFGFGGNKVRGLELLVADAERAGADVLVTGAGPQSNHVRATAVAGAYAGLEVEAVFFGDPPAVATGNLALTRLLGARCRYTGDPDRSSVDRGITAAAEALRLEGRRPYEIPRGGACALGVLGHVRAAMELDEQCRAVGVQPGAVVLAVGSGATLAGWLLGRHLLGAGWRVEGVTVSRPAAEACQRIHALALAAAALLEADVVLGQGDITVHEGFLGPGYGVPTAEGLAAIRLAAARAGVFLDPTYTGKAMAGLLELARRGQLGDGPVVFVHTGGEPALFASEIADTEVLR